jgi:hypothetical protein
MLTGRLFVYIFFALGYLAASGACTLANGVGLDPAVPCAAAMVLPELADLGQDSALGTLQVLRSLSRHRLERSLRLAQRANLFKPSLASRRFFGPRNPMRKFTQHVEWDDVLDRLNEVEFRKAHGLSYEAFMDVAEAIRPLVENELDGRGGQRNGNFFSAEIKLHMVLRWLRGGQFHDFLVPFGISKAAFYATAWRVCSAICARYTLPMAEAVKAARRGDDSHFERWAKGFAAFTLGVIAHCFGAIDGVQISIKKPTEKESPNPAAYFNRFSKATINVQAIADSTGRILWIAVNAPGGMHDHQALAITRMADVLASLLASLGYYAVGDEAYVNGPGMLTPISTPVAGTPEDHFNYFQSLTRNPIERAFGMVERRWGILWRRLEVGLAHVPLVLRTCVLLHNICMDYAVPIEDLDEVTPERRLPRTSDGETHQGRRFDLEATETRDDIVAMLSVRGLRRPAVDAPRRPTAVRGRGCGRGRGRGCGRM